jgi:CheY-like chemotaxis protein
VVALTGYISAEDQARAFRSGFQAYLIKPAELVNLIDTVAKFADAPLR